MRRALAHLTALPVHAERPGSQATWLAVVVVGALLGVVWVLLGSLASALRAPVAGAALVVLADLALTRGQLYGGFATAVAGLWPHRPHAGADTDDQAEPAPDPTGDDGDDEQAVIAGEAIVAAIRSVGGVEPVAVAATAAMVVLRFAVVLSAWVGVVGPVLGGLVPQATLALVAVPAAGRLALVAWWALLPRRDDEPDPLAAPAPGVAAVVVGAALVLALGLPVGWRSPAALVATFAVVMLAAQWWRARVGVAPPAATGAAVALTAETAALLVLAPGA